MNAQAAASLLHFAEETVPGLRGLDGKAAASALEQRYGELLEALRTVGRGDCSKRQL